MAHFILPLPAILFFVDLAVLILEGEFSVQESARFPYSFYTMTTILVTSDPVERTKKMIYHLGRVIGLDD